MIIKNVNHLKLLREFDDNSILYDTQTLTNNAIYENGKMIGTSDLSINFLEGTDMTLVQAVINSHDPSPDIEDLPQTSLEQQLAQLKIEKDALEETVEMVLVDILPTIIGE